MATRPGRYRSGLQPPAHSQHVQATFSIFSSHESPVALLALVSLLSLHSAYSIYNTKHSVLLHYHAIMPIIMPIAPLPCQRPNFSNSGCKLQLSPVRSPSDVLAIQPAKHDNVLIHAPTGLSLALYLFYHPGFPMVAMISSDGQHKPPNIISQWYPSHPPRLRLDSAFPQCADDISVGTSVQPDGTEARLAWKPP